MRWGASSSFRAWRSPGTSMGSWTGMRQLQYSQHTCPECCPSPDSKYSGSAGPPSPSPTSTPAAVLPCPSLLIFPWTWPFPRQGTTCKYFGVVGHVRGGEGPSWKVGDPITEIVVTRRDEAALISVQGVEDCEVRPTSITMGQKVGWLDVIAKEEGVPPILRP